MGKIQCVSSLKTRSDSWQVIEKYLDNINTPIEKKIHDEYYSLKNVRVKTTQDVSHIPVLKRFNRFIKWYKMAFPGNDIETRRHTVNGGSPKQDNRRMSNIHTLDNNSDVLSTSFGNQSPVKSVKSIGNAQHFSYELESESGFTQMSTSNHVEFNLRNCYYINNTNFCKRVYKSPPESLRWLSWLISSEVPRDRSEELFNHHLKQPIDNKVDVQIKKDLNRTLSEIYDINPNDTQNHLYRVLRTFSSIDKTVGYCQGMNFIAGFLLLISDFNEVDSFYMMLNLFSETFSDNFGIRGFFTEDFPLLNAYLYVFDHYFEKEFPLLFNHFKELEIPHEVWIAKWFQTLYTICLPFNILIRFWDCLFSSGLQFLISFSLALVQQLEIDLLKLTDAFDVIDYFKKMGPFFTTAGDKMKFHLNIEEIVTKAKKLFNLPRTDVQELLKKYENSNLKSLANLRTLYEVDGFKPQKNCDISCELFTNRSTITSKFERIVLMQDIDEEIYDCDEENYDNLCNKMENYRISIKQTPNTVGEND
jgi:hypothetical protein